MLKILRLEYLFNRKPLLIVLAIFTAYFAYMAYQFPSPRVFLVITSLMIGLSIPFTILGREDKFKTASLVCSLPVNRATVVVGKYVATWGAIILGLVYALVLAAVLPFAKISVGSILTLKSLLVSLLLMSVMFAVILPFTIRFGFVGIIVLLVGFQFLGVIALFLAQIGKGANNPMRVLFRTAEGGLRGLLYHESTPGFLLALLAAILAVNAVSLLISTALYARRSL